MQEEDVLDCDRVPVAHGVELTDAEGDGVPVEDRHAEDVPQEVGEVEADRENVPE